MSLVCGTAEYLVKVPDGIWVAITGSIIGASLTLLGVWRSNANSRRQLKMQLKHETERELAEREMAIRKEVFLDVASWASAGFQKVVKLLDINSDDTGTAVDLATSSTPGRVQVVGNNATIQACGTFGAAVTEALAQIHPLRHALLASKQKLGQLKQAEKDAAETGTPDKTIVIAIKRLEEEQDKVARNFVTTTFDHAEKLGGLEVELNIAMRRELALPLDEAAYREYSTRTNRIQRLSVDLMLEELADRRANE
jgi:hypothetical protein